MNPGVPRPHCPDPLEEIQWPKRPGFRVEEEPLRVNRVPTAEDLAEAEEFGVGIAASW